MTAPSAKAPAGRPVRRREDWPARLAESLAARRAMPFEWGANDCCLFAAAGVLAMTGVDCARPWRGYKSARGARNRVEKAGGVPALAEAACGVMGWPEIGPAFAQRGDLVVLETLYGPGLGLVGLNGREIHCPGPAQLESLALARAQRAWRIG